MNVRRPVSDWGLSLIGVAPFLSLSLIQAWERPAGYVDTWFLQYDMPYYEANGRAIFERGNGLSGPNPYDPDPSAPAIYFQWLVWLLGLGVHAFGLEPGPLLFGVGAVAAVVFSRLTLALVERCGTGDRDRVPLFLLAMWGGGVAVAAEVARSVVLPSRQTSSILCFEPMGGWWMPSWGRNAVLPMEAVYHALMAGAWLAALDRRWRVCLACLVLLATTHPFSGFQAIAIFLPWAFLVRYRRDGETIPAWFLGGLGALTLAFFGYYFGFLPRFAQHRALQEEWALPWNGTPIQAVAVYGLVAIPAAIALGRDRGRLDPGRLLLLCIAVVSFGLSNHHWLVKPRQPLHFTHGYVWMPLFLLGVPVLRDALGWARASRPRLALAAAVGLLTCVDNVTWLGLEAAKIRRTALDLAASGGKGGGAVDLRYIPEGLRSAYREIDRRGLRGVLASDDAETSYLAPTYCGCRVTYGHRFNTPRYEDRRRRTLDWLNKGGEPPKPGVDMILVRGDRRPGAATGFRRTFESGGWSLYEPED